MDTGTPKSKTQLSNGILKDLFTCLYPLSKGKTLKGHM